MRWGLRTRARCIFGPGPDGGGGLDLFCGREGHVADALGKAWGGRLLDAASGVWGEGTDWEGCSGWCAGSPGNVGRYVVLGWVPGAGLWREVRGRGLRGKGWGYLEARGRGRRGWLGEERTRTRDASRENRNV